MFEVTDVGFVEGVLKASDVGDIEETLYEVAITRVF